MTHTRIHGMFMYVCVCIYICTHICVCVCMCVWCMYVHTYVRMSVCVCVYVYIYIYICTFVCIYLYTNVFVSGCVYVCMYVSNFVCEYARRFQKKTEHLLQRHYCWFYSILSTVPFKVVPLLAIHSSQRFFHCWDNSWNPLTVMALSSPFPFSWISCMVWKRRPFKVVLGLENRKKSAGFNSGE